MTMQQRSTRAPQQGRGFQVGAAVRAVALLLLMSSLIPTGAAAAEKPSQEGTGELQRVSASVITPPSDLLSGIAAAAITGQDPRWAGHLPTGVSIPDLTNSVEAAAAGSARNGATGLNQQVPFRNPAPAFSRNLMISRAVGNYPTSTEPHIAADPTDPDHLVMGVIDFNLPSIAIYVSFDGGQTWDGPHQPRYFREDFAVGGDPTIAFDRDGNVYASLLSIGIEEFQIGNLVSYTTVSSVVVAKSTDGGLTWGDGIPAARSRVTTVSNVDSAGKERGIITAGFLDKEWMTVGPSKDDPNTDAIYLTYTDFESSNTVIYSDEVPYLVPIATETTIRMVKSEDGGVTWSQPVPVSPTARYAESYSGGIGSGGTDEMNLLDLPATTTDGTASNAGGNGTSQVEQATTSALRPQRFVQGSQPKVLSDGTVVVAWFDSTDDGPGQGMQLIVVARSTDGGRSFGDPIQAAVGREWHSPTRTIQLRIDGSKFPQMAVGPNDEIYIGFAAQPVDKPKDDGDIYLIASFDKGQTWDQPVRVNQDEKGTVQFLPAVAVNPNGEVGVMWGDTRDDPDEIRYNVYFTKSEDKGKTFGFTLPDQNFTAPDSRVSDFPSSSNRVCPTCAPEVGDYWAMAANEKGYYLVWGDTRLGEFGGFNTQIAFARTEAIPNPSLFLNPPSGTAGRVVDIQGHGFQPDSNILLLVSGVIVANPRSDDTGVFTTSIYMPLTGEGPTSISAFDETGNAATASFYTEFGFDTLQRSLDAINKEVGITTPVTGAATPAAAPPAAATPATRTPASGPHFSTPGPSPTATPAGSPAAATSGGSTASGEAALALSTTVGRPSFGGLGYALVAFGMATCGALFWRRRPSRQSSGVSR
jgi:hypothetical protein